MSITEFTVDKNTDNVDPCTLFISDAALLVRPRVVHGQYPANVNHDTVHAYEVLDLGNDMATYQWHIVYKGDPHAAHRLLDRVFYAYIDGCCLQQWCDARVCYIVNGKTVRVVEYGFEDGSYTLVFNVYCGIAGDNTEEFLASLTAAETGRFIVVRPGSSENDYSLHGFTVGQSDEADIYDGPYGNDDREDECRGGCGQPAACCTCIELESFRNHDPYDGAWTA
jgi:hypothetical protein